MALRGEHDRGIDQGSLVPSPPSGSLKHQHTSAGAFGLTFVLSEAEGIHPHSYCAGDVFSKGGLCMRRRPRSRAVPCPAWRHPACLPRAGLPEAGRRAPWDENTTSSM